MLIYDVQEKELHVFQEVGEEVPVTFTASSTPGLV